MYILPNKHPTPNFGRLLETFKFKEPDRVPLCEISVDHQIKEAFLKKPINDIKMEVEFWVNAGYDAIPIFIAPPMPQKLDVSYTKNEYSIDNSCESARHWICETSGIVNSEADFEKFILPAQIDDSLFIRLEEISKHLPQDMKIIGVSNGVFDPVTQAMGLQNFSYKLVEEPDLIKIICSKVEELQIEIFRRIAQFDAVGALWIADDLAYSTSLLVSPSFLRNRVLPCYKKISEIANTANFPLIFHSDGNIELIIEDLIQCGINVLHPIEPKAMDIVDMKKKYYGKLALIGNIDLSYTLTRGTREDVENEVKEKIRQLAYGGGYCVSSSNSVPNYTPIENFIAMNTTCLKWGKYPIPNELKKNF